MKTRELLFGLLGVAGGAVVGAVVTILIIGSTLKANLATIPPVKPPQPGVAAKPIDSKKIEKRCKELTKEADDTYAAAQLCGLVQNVFNVSCITADIKAVAKSTAALEVCSLLN